MDSVNTRIYPYDSVDLARTFTEWDSPLLSAEYMYIQLFEDLAVVKNKLIEKEREAGFFNTEMKRKWETLKKKQLDFIQDVRKYDKFYRENEEKCKRMSEKIEKQKQKQKLYTNKIRINEKRIEYLENIIDSMNCSVENLRQFHVFLISLKKEEEEEEEEEEDMYVEKLIHNCTLLNSQSELYNEINELEIEAEENFQSTEYYMKVKKILIQDQTQNLMSIKKRSEENENRILLKKFEYSKIHKERKEIFKENLSIMWSFDNAYHMLTSCRLLTSSINPKLIAQTPKATLIIKLIKEARRILAEVNGVVKKSNLSCEVHSTNISEKRFL